MKRSSERAILGLILLLTVVVYTPALKGGFVWDDDAYVTGNAALRSIDGLRRIWFDASATPQYYPLVFTTFWIEYRLWHLAPLGYHLVNVLLHCLVVVLLWVLLRRLRIPGALLAAAVFALHPVHVESVAWITERKNVLSGVFYLSSLWAYLHFRPLEANHAGVKPARWGWYAAALSLFALALLSKTVTCTLPVVIVLLTWWRGCRLRAGQMLPLAPMFAMGALMGSVTAWVEMHFIGARGEEWGAGFLSRCLVAGRALWFYVWKLLWPAELVFIYPRWNPDSGMWWWYIFPVAFIILLGSLWFFRKRIGRGSIAAALFFIITIAPALGFFNVYIMRYSFVADHFQYLASIGPITLFAALAARMFDEIGRRSVHREKPFQNLLPRAPRGLKPAAQARFEIPSKTDRRTLFSPAGIRLTLAGLLLAVLAARSFAQATMYIDEELLWRDTLKRNPKAWIAHNNLGLILDVRGETDEAARHYSEALRLKPDLAEAHTNLGALLEEEGRTGEAFEHLKEAVRIDPHLFIARHNLATALARHNRLEEAEEAYREALRIRPAAVETRCALASLLIQRGRLEEAARELRKALRADPRHERAAELLRAAETAHGR